MKLLISAAVCAAVVPSAVLLAGGQDPQGATEIGKMFQEQCIGCHQPPDTRFATDRAWLEQISSTA
ncbi:MAG: hypothetical protein IH851_00875 [Armatimonadetes bacterium]|nr:hypothetical protein [Armatimonadota bacterium]